MADVSPRGHLFAFGHGGLYRGSVERALLLKGAIRMTEQVDTIIVRGGQGGLATSYHLTLQGREHVILEQAERAAEAWRHRWDSFTLITPNWMTRLPGAEYQGDDPDGFMPRDKVIAYFEEYVRRFELPIRYGIRVTAVEPTETGYLVRTGKTEYKAANVVMATGMYQHPRIPILSADLSPEIHQLHSSEYHNPETLPAGAVLVVGSAQSGVVCQVVCKSGQVRQRAWASISF